MTTRVMAHLARAGPPAVSWPVRRRNAPPKDEGGDAAAPDAVEQPVVQASSALRSQLKRKHTADLSIEGINENSFKETDLNAFGVYVDAEEVCSACGSHRGLGWRCLCFTELGSTCVTAEAIGDFRNAVKLDLSPCTHFCVHAESLRDVDAMALQHLRRHHLSLQHKMVCLRE